MQGLADAAQRSTESRTFNGDGCPTEWLWQRVDEMNGVARTPRSYFERGTLGHAMIEARLNGSDPWQVFADYQPPAGEWLETSKCTKEGLLDEVAAVYEAWETQFNTLEEYQGYDQVNTEVRLECVTPNGTEVSTEADAIFWWGDSPALADWKLGTSRSGKAMQLYMYWYVARKSGYVPDDAPFRAWFHYPTYSRTSIVHIVDYPGDEFVEAYIDNAEAGRKGGPYLPNPDWFNCSQCEYKERCPLWGGDYAETQEVEVIFV
jgi:hypothetical protein